MNIREMLCWSIITFLMILSFIISLIYKKPEDILFSMAVALYFFRPYAILTHVIFITILLQGIIFQKINDELYAGLMGFIAITTTIIGLLFMFIPEIILFALIFVLTMNAYFKKQLRWDLRNTDTISRISGTFGFIFGFWYLYWVEEPIWVNALISSPLGILNSPTLLIICGFLCLNREPRSNKLELTVAIISLWIGLMGVIRFGIYIDIVLITISLFLLIRVIYYIYRDGLSVNQE